MVPALLWDCALTNRNCRDDSQPHLDRQTLASRMLASTSVRARRNSTGMASSTLTMTTSTSKYQGTSHNTHPSHLPRHHVLRHHLSPDRASSLRLLYNLIPRLTRDRRRSWSTHRTRPSRSPLLYVHIQVFIHSPSRLGLRPNPTLTFRIPIHLLLHPFTLHQIVLRLQSRSYGAG